MSLTLDIPEGIKRTFQSGAARRGVPETKYFTELVELAAAQDALAELYADSLECGGELTAATQAQDDLHEYSPDELAAMEAGQFEQPLQ